MRKFPQRLLNVRVAERGDPCAIPAVTAAVQSAEVQLGARGRVLLRPSGTEPVIRVMVEGEDAAEVDALAQTIAKAVESAMAA
jgi:phosphoglucosamine mutase